MRQIKQEQNNKKLVKNIFKWFVAAIFILIIGGAIWVGATAFRSIQKITGETQDNNSILSIFKKENVPLKGQSEGRTNILMLGMGGKNHPGGGLTDTIIILSINWQTKKVAMISLPRDLWVYVPGYGYSKLNAAYYYSDKASKTAGAGGKATSEIISKISGVPIHYYLTIDFDGFKKVIDSVGGIDINVTKEIYDPFYPAADMIHYDPFRIKAGPQHLDGATALKYARSRETTSDFDRSRRQEEILVSTKDRIISLETLSNPKRLTDILTALGDHFRTNMSIAEVKSLWESVKGFNSEHIINKVFDTSPNGPLKSSQDETRGYIILPRLGAENYTEVQEIIRNIFDSKTQSEVIKIEIYNGTKQTGIAVKLGAQLEGYGYEVIKTANATKTYTENIIYDCGGTKTKTAASDLAARLKAKVEQKTTCGLADMQIYLGGNSL